MKIKEMLNITGWMTLCTTIFDKAGLTIGETEIDETEYGKCLARRIFAKYGNKPVNDQYATYVDISGEDAIDDMADDIVLTYKNSWQNMLTALTTEYNPLENYDRNQYDYRTSTKEGSITEGQRSDTKGQQIDTDGQHTIQYGAQSNTKGQQVNSTAAYQDTQETQKSAYDQTGYSADTKVITDGDDRQITEGSRTDSLGQHTDTYGEHGYTSGQRIDIKGQQTDTTHDHDEELFDSHVHGNIGVTTSQQMLESEMVLRMKYRFVDIVTKDLINEMTLKCY